MASEVGARGGSEVVKTEGRENSMPEVMLRTPTPKHGPVNSHSKTGPNGRSVVALGVVVIAGTVIDEGGVVNI